MRMRIVIPSLVATAVLAIPAVAPADDGVSACNEAEDSPRGGYVVTGGPVDRLRPPSCAARRCESAAATGWAWSTPPSTRRRCARAAPKAATTRAPAATSDLTRIDAPRSRV